MRSEYFTASWQEYYRLTGGRERMFWNPKCEGCLPADVIPHKCRRLSGAGMPCKCSCPRSSADRAAAS